MIVSLRIHLRNFADEIPISPHDLSRLKPFRQHLSTYHQHMIPHPPLLETLRLLHAIVFRFQRSIDSSELFRGTFAELARLLAQLKDRD